MAEQLRCQNSDVTVLTVVISNFDLLSLYDYSDMQRKGIWEAPEIIRPC